MKYFLIILFCLVLVSTGCSKKNITYNDCTAVTVTQSGTPCGVWGIKVNANVYPSNTIPAEFQQEGLFVCANYDLYQDLRLCACCGGTWAKINSMKRFVR
jgi:hypothetical protein